MVYICVSFINKTRIRYYIDSICIFKNKPVLQGEQDPKIYGKAARKINFVVKLTLE